MASTHKNKTLTTLLAAALGGTGIHRFYLRGWKDIWAWLHLSSIPLSTIALNFDSARPALLLLSPVILSMLAGFLEALVLGLTADDIWDKKYNSASEQESKSNWPLAVLLVLTLGVGATALIALIARTFDLFFTGGAYG
jgi:Mn2+/Fe2+ NRAMP family transporter